MPASYFTMWGVLILTALGALGGGVVHGDLLGFIWSAYLSDLAKQEASHRCGRMDAQFSRFSQSDRGTCYHLILPAAARASSDVAVEW